MKKNILKIFVVLLGVLLFCRCSSVETLKSGDVEQRLIFPQYFIKYNSLDSSFEASARFNLNNAVGTAVRLSGASNVSFNGTPLKGEVDKSEQTYQYVFRSGGAMPKSFSFVYLNNDNQEFLNDITMNPFEVKVKSLSISKTSDTQIEYIGKPLADNETLEIVLTQDGTDVNYGFPCYQSSESVHKILVLSEDIDAPAGEYVLQFVRRSSSSEIRAAERGGIWETEYLSKTMKVTLY